MRGVCIYRAEGVKDKLIDENGNVVNNIRYIHHNYVVVPCACGRVGTYSV